MEEQHQPVDQPAVSNKPKKPSLAQRTKTSTDGFMAQKLKMGDKSRRMTWHYLGLLWEQLRAMLPITLLQVLVLAIFFRKSTPTPALEAAGLISAVIGLVLFLEGLRVAIMPMAMLVGTQLPKRLKLPLVLLVAFCLGVLVTYAEPAIAAIRPLASLVDPSSAPYLYYMMNQQQEIMVLAIGVGVGVAAVIGTLKFLYDISLKPLIAGALLPTIGLACYMQWGHEHLQPLLGVAWDCGAVTTGPVTVPVLLALGVGVMDAQRQKRAALAVLEDAALKKSEGASLEGFGIVTLASLLPVLAVELMACITGAMHSYEYVLEQAQLAAEKAKATVLPPVELSPVKEVVYAVRAITPLLVALVLLVTVVLRQPLPAKGFTDMDEEEEEDAQQQRDKEQQKDAKMAAGKDASDVEVCSDQDAKVSPAHDASSKDVSSTSPTNDRSRHNNNSRVMTPDNDVTGPGARQPSIFAKAVILNTDDKWAKDYYDLEGQDSVHGGSAFSESSITSGDSRASTASQKVAGCLGVLKKYKSLIIAMLMCQVGMILFNLGLTYGFSALGDMTGVTLPAAFLAVPYDNKSPYYSFAGGVVLTMATIFLLGILATKAEPALNVLGDTVETLSGGKFTKRALIWAVCVGVAVGMCAGALKILFQLPLIWFIIVKYAVAGGLTVVARESITAVAWDSAGFGMLTVMSVAPIISVLLASVMKAPAKAAVSTLARVSRIPLQKVSRGLHNAYSGGSGGGEGSNHGALALGAIPEAHGSVTNASAAAVADDKR